MANRFDVGGVGGSPPSPWQAPYSGDTLLIDHDEANNRLVLGGALASATEARLRATGVGAAPRLVTVPVSAGSIDISIDALGPSGLGIVPSGADPLDVVHLVLVKSGGQTYAQGFEALLSEVPTNLSATTISASQIDLTWAASPGSPLSYNIYRYWPLSPSAMPTVELVGNSATTAFSHTGLQGLTRYGYYVTAVHPSGETAFSLPDTADTTEPANTIWVSPSGGGSGTSQGSPTTLAVANSSVVKGGMVALLNGDYGSANINPATSATSTQESDRVTYKAVPGAAPTFTAGSQAATLTNRSYVTLDGIIADGGSAITTPFGIIVRFDNSHRCKMVNCSLSWSTNSTVMITGASTHIYLLYNYIVGAGDISVGSNSPDIIRVRLANYVLIEGNTGKWGAHGLLAIQNASTADVGTVQRYIVIRNNDLSNNWDDAGPLEMRSPLGHSNRQIEFMNIEYAVFENNLCREHPYGTNSTPNHDGENKCQGNRLIFRKNYFMTQYSSGINGTARPPESPMTTECRIYNNSFWGMNAAGRTAEGTWSLTYIGGDVTDTRDNTFKNNAVRDSDTLQPELVWPLNTGGIDGNGNSVISNTFYPSPGELRVNTTFRTLEEWEASPPTGSGEIRDNLNIDTDWVGGAAPTSKEGFVPNVGSPLIGAGDWLTTTVGAGSGTTMVVNDARYFFDGYDLENVLGDEIQLEGQTVTARITDVNYDTNTLTLDTALTWTADLGVALPYSGSAPDIGAVQILSNAVPIVTPLWANNTEADVDRWWGWPTQAGAWDSGTATRAMSTEQAHSGTRSAKCTVDVSSGVSGVRLAHAGRDDYNNFPPNNILPDGYYSAWFYFPTVMDYGTVGMNFFQFKRARVSPDGSDPIYDLNLQTNAQGDMYMRLSDHINDSGQYVSAVWRWTDTEIVPINQWIHVEVYYTWRMDLTGEIRCWVDGVEKFQFTNIITEFTGTEYLNKTTEPRQWSVNNYIWGSAANGVSPSVSSIYIDDAVISSERVYGKIINFPPAP